MGVIGKAKGLFKKIGKVNPSAIAKKVGKMSHKVLDTAKNVMSKAEVIGKKIGDVPIIGEYAKQLYKAPLIKGMSLQMLHKGAKTSLVVADKGLKVYDKIAGQIPKGDIKSIAKQQFSNKRLTNIGNSHLSSRTNSAKTLNDLINSNKHPVIKSRNIGISKHIQALNIMKSTPISQVPRTVIHATRGGLG